MGLSVCPLAVVAAPVEIVWANLTQWERYPAWAGVRAERVDPEGPATAGQTVVFKGMGLRMRFEIEAVDPVRHELDAHVFFPFGLQEKPHIVCTPIDAVTCRVQYQ